MLPYEGAYHFPKTEPVISESVENLDSYSLEVYMAIPGNMASVFRTVPNLVAVRPNAHSYPILKTVMANAEPIVY